LQPNAVALGQELLEGILIKAIVDRFGVKVEHAKEFVSFKSTGDLVTAQLHVTATDSTTSSEVAEAKYLVGTDGGHSRVRKQLGFAFEGEALPGVMIIGDIQVDGLDPVVCQRLYATYLRRSAHAHVVS
jgi:2-polyprenyl-6-methoxyphenol hydroxylase-like FAD-dependent oxidoreductase